MGMMGVSDEVEEDMWTGVGYLLSIKKRKDHDRNILLHYHF